MALNNNDHDTFRHYLLGELAGDSLEEFEKRLLTDDEVFEELLAAEDELVDEYAGGHLGSDEREMFENHFLITSERQQDLDFAHTLRRFVHQKAPPRPVRPGYERMQAWMVRAAAAIAISLVGLLAFFIPRTAQTVATVTLPPSVSTRAEGPQPTNVSLGDADALKISLKLPQGFTTATRYRAELARETGEAKLVDVAVEDTQTVTVQISASELTRGQYVLKLYAVETGGMDQVIVGNYFFKVE